MPGRSAERQRVIVSSRLLVPIGCCGKSIDLRAAEFKSAIEASINQPRLNAGIAVKAMPTYEDTDNRKREFTADQRPGVADDGWGHRVESAKMWEPGSILVLSPSRSSMESLSTLPNMGWITPEPVMYNSVEGMISDRANKPSIRLTVYDVDPKTDDVIQGSERVIDPFAPKSGMTQTERQKQLRKYFKDTPSDLEEKALGRALKDRVPGGSLITRVAAAFGVLRDSRNKFRCPPGTPAANQFTDAYGSNCFGISPSKFSRFVQRQAARMEADGELTGFRETADKFFRALYNNDWDVRYERIPYERYPNIDWTGVFELEDADPVLFGREPHYDALTGERVPSPEWFRVELGDDKRMFKNGMVNAQATVRRHRADADGFVSALGVDTSDEARRTNKDLEDAFNVLRERGWWDVQIVNVSGGGGRLVDSEVRDYVTARLKSIPGWLSLPQEQQDALIAADMARYYESERGFLTAAITQFLKNPEAARMLGRIEYDFSTNDEAGTGFYGGGKSGGPVRAVMHMNLERILSNQESMLPDLRANQRLAISAVGARTDAEAQAAVADFLYQSEQYNKVLAGQIDGPGSFGEFIGHHEFAHIYQGKAVINEVERQIANFGFVEIPIFDKNGRVAGVKQVDALEKLTGNDVMYLMQANGDGIDHEDLGNALDAIKNAQMLAGRYGSEHREGTELWALEASAELFATREMGLIWGDDVDAALAHMDDAIARPSRVATEQARVDADAADAESTANPPASPFPGFSGPIEDQDADTLRQYADSLEQDSMERAADRQRALADWKAQYAELDEDGMVDEVAAVAYQRDSALAFADEWEQKTYDAATLGSDKAEQLKRVNDILAERARRDAELYDKQYEEGRKAWRKKYGIGARGENERFDEMVQERRNATGLLTRQQEELLAQQLELDALRERASNMSDKDLVDEIVKTHRAMLAATPGSDQAFSLASSMEALKSQFVENRRRGGDKRGATRIMRDLEEQVEAIVSPKPKPSRKFKNASETKDFGKRERARLRSKIDKPVADAIKEAKDFESSPIIQMLAPDKQTAAGRAMNARNARLKRLGMTPDEKSAEEGSLVDQVEHILLPVMEAIDISSVSEPFEMEAIIELAPDSTRGNATGREIDVPSFTSGTMTRRGSKATEIRPSEARNKETGKTRRRVVISVREGDKGIFPSSGDDDQKFVIPPGSIRITGRDADGTLRAEIATQKDLVEVADSLVESLEGGYDDRIWRDGAARKVRATADKVILKMRSDGRLSSGSRDTSGDAIHQTNAAMHTDLADTGSVFGEALDDIRDYWSPRTPTGFGQMMRERNEAINWMLDGLGRGIFPPTLSRPDRKKQRERMVSDSLAELRKIASNQGSRELNTMARDSLDPRVLDLITGKSDEEIYDILYRSAYKLHSGFDRRVRVRMRDNDLAELSRSGMFRSPLASGRAEIPEMQSRRLNRLANMSPEERESRLSSGALGTLLNAWNDLNAADPDNLQLTQDLIANAVMLSSVQAAPLEAAARDAVRKIRRRLSRSRSASPRFSSGAIATSAQLEERSRLEKAVATGALATFDRIVDSGRKVSDMTDGELTEFFNGRVRRSGRQAIGVNEALSDVYEVDNVSTALALMMLGHHVEVDSSNLALTKQAQKQFEDLVKNAAEEKIQANHADWLRFRDQFARENPTIDITSDAGLREAKRQYKEQHQVDLCMLYDPETNLLCSGAIGIERGQMPQVNGRTTGHDTPAARAIKAGRAAGKWEPAKSLSTNEALLQKHADEIDKRNQKRIDKGKKPMKPEEVLYEIISEKHTLRTEYSQTAADNKASYDSLTPEEKQWLYDNTNWQDTEVNLEMPFINFLNEVIKTEDGGPAVVTKRVVASSYAPSQQQLVGSKVDSTNEEMTSDVIKIAETLTAEGFERGTPEFREEFTKRVFAKKPNGVAEYWWTNPILVTRDGYILDGHHRWGSVTVANMALDEDMQIPLSVFEVQTDIVEGLTLGKVFQQQWGIKDAKLGVEDPWKKGDIADIDDAEMAQTSSSLVQSVQDRVDQIYDEGHFIKLGSVGLKKNADYASTVRDRQTLSRSRRPSPYARERERELADALRMERLASGGTDRQSRTTATTVAERIRENNAIADAALRRANIDAENKEKIKFALGVLDGIEDAEDNVSASDALALIAERSGDSIAKASAVELAHRIIGREQAQTQRPARFGQASDPEMEKQMEAGRLLREAGLIPEKIVDDERIENAIQNALQAMSQRRFGMGTDDGNKRNASRSSGRLARAKKQTFKKGSRSQNVITEDAEAGSRGAASGTLAREYAASIGLSPDIDDDMLPVSGYVVHKSQIAARQRAVRANGQGNANMNAVFEVGDEDIFGDGLTALGDIEVVLKPQVSNRTAYGRSDGITSGNKPVKLNSANKDDILDAMIGNPGKKSKRQNTETMLHLLGAAVDGDYSKVNASFDENDRMIGAPNGTSTPKSRTPFEAQILGGFDIDEVEQVNYPASRLSAVSRDEDISDVVNERSIADRLRKAGFSEEEIEYFYSVNGAKNLNTESMSRLREYRAAQKIKKQLTQSGFKKVKFAHRDGIDIEDPRSYAKGADLADNVEKVLRDQIMHEIRMSAQKALKGMRSGGSPSLVSREGARA